MQDRSIFMPKKENVSEAEKLKKVIKEKILNS